MCLGCPPNFRRFSKVWTLLSESLPQWTELRDKEKVMPAFGEDDPGRSYRRGYQDGAVETFRAIERFLDVATREVVRTWIEQDVNDWRLKATLSHPPIWRLNKLNAPNSNCDIRANFPP